MAYQETHFPHVENVGQFDRINRVIVGTTLIIVTVLFTAIPAAAVASIVALGIYIGLTGFIGWDPVYALVNAFKHQVSAQTHSMVADQKRHGDQPSSGSYKKAA